jgi:polysaccharide pyruvyl transferase WcaK-like protein
LAHCLVEFCPVEIVEPASPDAVRERMSHLSAFIGARYHSILLAYQSGVPVAPVLYHEKCISLSDSIGLEFSTRIGPQMFLNVERITTILDALYRSRNRFVPAVPIEAATRDAARGAGEIAQLLSRRH